MVLRLMTSRASKLLKKTQEVTQHFKYFLVLDFEATCEKDVPIQTPEIIEFPCLALNTSSWEVDDTFHRYVKPRVNPVLSSFCTDLTGIMQETIQDEEHFPRVYEDFCSWVERNEFNGEAKRGALVTCGDWDLKVMLPSQCALDDLPVADFCKRWINLKRTYCDVTQYYPRSLRDMMVRLNLRPEGQAHSGLHDSLNMIRIMQKLAKDHKAQFSLTSSS